MKRILLAIDFSDITRSVVDMAIKIASGEASTEICLMHVDAQSFCSDLALSNLCEMNTGMGIQIIGDQSLTYYGPPDELMEDHSYAERGIITEYADYIRQSGIDVTTKIIAGLPSQEICSTAEQIHAECIVVGAHSHGKLHHLFFREVVSYLLNHAPCPVLVTR